MTDLSHPVRLSRAGAWRTYTGGRLIEKLHGNDNGADTNFPEEWIMSTVRARNSGREDIVEGLSMLYGTDISLSQLISENPDAALGAKHTAKYGNSLGVLLKLLDSAERLTIQVHPTREKAMALFGSRFGKTECWHILDTRKIGEETPCIYLGFAPGITRDAWVDIFNRQDISAMLSCLNRFEVKAGDTFLIEGGVPHAIGAGCFLTEIQEPTDYTVRTERTTPSHLAVSDFMCHQGLGFDKMFDCFSYVGMTGDEVLSKWQIKKRKNTLIDYSDTEMFGLELIDEECSEIDSNGAFSGIYILGGSGKIYDTDVKAGDQFFISASCEPFTVQGKVKYLRFYGPKL